MVAGSRRSLWSRHFAVAIVIAAVISLASWRNTDFSSPPRFDGAGYAVLAESLMTGRGYREIDHPDAPRHAHFPPGYPAALGLFWSATGGRSATSAHLFSIACTVAATLTGWLWLRTMYNPRVAGLLGLALAVNWTWGRNGGAIQSEPLYLLLEQLTLLTTVGVCRRGGIGSGIGLGALLGASALTRQVGVALIAAAGLSSLLKRRWISALAAGLTSTLLILPWIVWLASVRENTQAELVGGGTGGLARLIVSQVIFNTQRLPDQLIGPFVEVGTAFSKRDVSNLALNFNGISRELAIFILVNIWAVFATVLLLLGWFRTLGSSRRRLAGLTALSTLALLLVWPFTEAGRFLIPLVPCMLVGAVEGLSILMARFSLKRRMIRTIAASIVLVLSLPYASYALWSNRAEAQGLTHSGFDAACAWIAMRQDHPGPVLSRHPGEVYWRTQRQALAPASNDPAAISREIARRHIAFLLVDDDRYLNAPANPLSRFLQEHAFEVREVWSRATGRSSFRVFEVMRSSTMD